MKAAALALVGVYACVVGAIVHRHVWGVGGFDVPWSVLLVIASSYLVTVAAGHLVRLGGAWFALGWAAGLLALQISPGGSFLIASDWLGWTFTGGCVGAIVVGVVKPPRLTT